MRFEDWDVLIFPGIGQDAHIPVQEFGVECYAVTDDRLLKDETITVPLVTGFIPSLEYGQPFQISLHSWRPKPFTFRPAAAESAGAPQVWQFKVTIDGEVKCADTMTADVQWPKVVHQTTAHAGRCGKPEQLLFPPFHQDRIWDTQWHPYADRGRIKVEIAEGFLQKCGSNTDFVKLTVHAIFNFQHAPLRVLKECGKAWPGPEILDKKRLSAPHMVDNATEDLVATEYQEPERFRHHTSGVRRRSHQRHASNYSMFLSSSPMYSNMPGAPPPTPSYGPGTYPSRQPHDGNSTRSTSAYSNISRSAMPLMSHFSPAFAGHPHPSTEGMPDVTRPPVYDPNLEIRIPSDQLQKVVTLLESRVNGSAMAPPPLPLHAMEARSSGLHVEQATGEFGVNVKDNDNMDDRRAASRSNYSDVSMHAGCGDFPRCTSEDADGHIVHHQGPGCAPAAVMRSRKEGHNDQLNRDFPLNVPNGESDGSANMLTSETHAPDSLPPPTAVEDVGKKRTRASARTVSVNEGGSPEKQAIEANKPARKLRKRVTAGAEGA